MPTRSYTKMEEDAIDSDGESTIEVATYMHGHTIILITISVSYIDKHNNIAMPAHGQLIVRL